MRQSTSFLILSLLFSLALACFVEHRVFLDPLVFNDDVRNQVYWMARIIDPTLFPNDYIAAYFTQPLLVSPILFCLYSMASLFISPLVFSQFLPFALVLAATFFLFKFSEKYVDAQYAALTCFAFNCSIWIYKNLAGGLSRAFFYPLFFFLLWKMSTGQWRWVVGTLWAASLIYPPVFFVGLVLLAIEAWSHRKAGDENHSRILAVAWSLGGSLILAAGRLFLFPHTDRFGELTTAHAAEAMRFFNQGGRVVLFPFNYEPESLTFPLSFLVDIIERLPHLYIIIPTLVFAGLIFLYDRFLKPRLGPLLIPDLLWKTLIGSCILYVLAWVVLFYLYVPERYLQYTLPLVPVFMIAGIIYRLLKTWPSLKVSLLSIFVILGLLGTGFVWRSDLIRTEQQEMDLYAYLNSLPQDVMIAAPPSVASNIPLYSFRSVLLSNEVYIAFHRRYFRELEERLLDWLQAYYATDKAPVDRMIREYDVDYIVFQTYDYEENRLDDLPERYYHAFGKRFFQTLRHNEPDYFLNRLPDSCAVFRNRQFEVFRTADLAGKKCLAPSTGIFP